LATKNRIRYLMILSVF